MATPPIIVIAGYYGFGNWGDEATLQVLVHYLRAALPRARLTVLSNNPEQTARLHRTEAISRWNFFEIRRVLREASAFILGPGSLLQDATSTRSLLYYLGLLHWAHRCSVPMYLLGQGIGPLRSSRSQRWVAYILQRAELILTRDQASYRWAAAQSPHALLGEDLALLMFCDLSPCPSPNLTPSLSVNEEREGMGISSIGISLRPGLGPANLERLSRALTTLAKEEFKLVFLPFHTGQDLPVLKMLTTKESFPISLVEAHQPSDLWEAMKHLDLVIGMRLHSLVFALLLGLPFCALSYDPKVENFIRQVEEAGSHPIQWWQASEALDERVFVRQITELYAQRAAHRKCLQSARETLQSVAQETLNRAIDHIIRNLGER